MRALFACSVVALAAGCFILQPHTDVVAVNVRGPDVPSVVIRSQAEFEDFIRRATAHPYGNKLLAQRLEAAPPDFDRQVLVLVRYDTNGDSTYGFSTRGDHKGTLICNIRTRHLGMLRDHNPHWFAVAVDRPGPERIEVRVDGERQPNE